jgi:hypothetical protein
MSATIQEERCTGCGNPISVWEEGRCAFCRSDDRGDNQLLAHDSRGYLDEDGVTRIPCGCGCERPVIVPEPRDMELDDVKDILGHGTEVEIRLPREPMPWRREWIESLGGVIVIDPDAPMPLALQNDREDEAMNGQNGRAALDAMDAGEAQRPEGSAMTNGKRPNGYWTRERIIEAIKAFAAEHGRPPKGLDWVKSSSDNPTAGHVANVFGRWADAIVAAGFDRPVGGRGKAQREPEPEPEPAPLPVPAAPPEPPAPRPVAADPEKVDTFELFASLASEERIAYYEQLAKVAAAKAEALRDVRESVRMVRELETA